MRNTPDKVAAGQASVGQRSVKQSDSNLSYYMLAKQFS